MPEGQSIRAVIITAIPAEYSAVREHLSLLREDTHQGAVYEIGRFFGAGAGWDILIAEIGPGNVTAALESQRAINYFQPDVLMFVGVAGGIKDVSLGDVVAATKVYAYESGKAAEDFHTRPEIGLSGYGLTNRARAEARKKGWRSRRKGSGSSDDQTKVFVGPIAAGEKVVASTSSDVFRLIRHHYNDALAVEMEGRGVLAAAHSNYGVEALVVRGISDLIDDKANADAKGSQTLASINASAFAFEVLATYTPQKEQLQNPHVAHRPSRAGR
jgi:nucleoside phosphorylase